MASVAETRTAGKASSPPNTCRCVVLINGRAYSVRPAQREAGDDTRAFKLTSQQGPTYYVAQNDHGTACTCPDWTIRRQKAGEQCKHIRALTALRIFDAPTAAPKREGNGR